MSKGIYVALSGAVAQENALEATASNIANASTTGYQRLRPVFRQVLATASNGVGVSKVESGSGADRAGIKAGDVITEVDGKAVSSATSLRAIIGAHSPGDSLTLTVKRSGETKTFKVTVANVAPVVTAPADQNANEGTSKSFSLGSFTDPGDDGPWAVKVEWGDGSTDMTFTQAAPGSITDKSHTYADDGEYTVKVTVSEAGTAPTPSAGSSRRSPSSASRPCRDP